MLKLTLFETKKKEKKKRNFIKVKKFPTLTDM